MRVREIDILMIPGADRLSEDHWQSRWARKLSTAHMVAPTGSDRSDIDAWIDRIRAAAAAATRPVVMVAHGCGVAATVHAAARLARSRVAGGFLVAPREFEDPLPALPMAPVPFPTKLIGSSTDPACSVERAQQLGAAWHADTSIVAGAGGIDAASGHGPWPEGLLTFGLFLKKLG